MIALGMDSRISCFFQFISLEILIFSEGKWKVSGSEGEDKCVQRGLGGVGGGEDYH